MEEKSLFVAVLLFLAIALLLVLLYGGADTPC